MRTHHRLQISMWRTVTDDTKESIKGAQGLTSLSLYRQTRRYKHSHIFGYKQAYINFIRISCRLCCAKRQHENSPFSALFSVVSRTAVMVTFFQRFAPISGGLSFNVQDGAVLQQKKKKSKKKKKKKKKKNEDPRNFLSHFFPDWKVFKKLFSVHHHISAYNLLRETTQLIRYQGYTRETTQSPHSIMLSGNANHILWIFCSENNGRK